jgi:pyrimidine operon attenuation protein / uracil phosphoribosyltransferase
MSTKTLLLNNRQTTQKIRRIAHEILEQNFQETEIVFAGVVERGYFFAQLLEKFFNEISSIKTTIVRVQLDKRTPLQSEITLDCDTEKLKNKVIIITDDVLNTGKTAAFSLKPFLNIELKKLQTAFVVDRNHNSYPIGADYIGYSLSTSLQEHIHVEFENGEVRVFVE